MQSKSLSHAKTLLVLSLLIALTSWHFGTDWHDEAEGLAAALTSTTNEVTKSKNALGSLKSQLKADDRHLSLEEAISGAMLEVFNTRVNYGVSVATVTSAKKGGSGMTDLMTLAEDVPGSSLKSVKIKVTGTYSTYPELVAYLRNLQTYPVALVNLKVQEQSFELALRIYGSKA